MHRPELVILDEPTQGLDPLMQQEFYWSCTRCARGEAPSSCPPMMPEVEHVCDRVGITTDASPPSRTSTT